MLLVGKWFFVAGLVLFGLGFFWLLCFWVDTFGDDELDARGRFAVWVAAGLMFGGLVCWAVPVVLSGAGLS